MLTELGYTVVEAASAEEALKLVSDGLKPDLLLTDHLMPGMSGTDLSRTLLGRWGRLPVVVVSGYAESEGIAPDLPRLTKPFRNDELESSLAALSKSD
jgi:CheY-like chemotaxis protein